MTVASARVARRAEASPCGANGPVELSRRSALRPNKTTASPSTGSFDAFGRDLWQTRRGLNVDVGTP